jgi:hypothetical protein
MHGPGQINQACSLLDSPFSFSDLHDRVMPSLIFLFSVFRSEGHLSSTLVSAKPHLERTESLAEMHAHAHV